jgi:hypothetical protein
VTVNVTSYSGLKSAIQAWMARSGDPLLDSRFDDCLALHEQRMYYGAKELPGLLPQFEPLRIREMEALNTAFTIGSLVAQPTGFLELIEASQNSPYSPIRLEHEGVFAAYGDQTLSDAKIMAISGTNFRFKENTAGTATLKYYAKLTTPTASTANWILQNAPGVYLNGCLIEAAILTSDFDSATKYGLLYASQVGGLNERRNRELAGATNVRMRVRGKTP